MLNTLEARHHFEQRIAVLFILAALLFLALFIRLVDLQWLRHENFVVQAEHNRINIVPVLPTRGEIVDRNGQLLAANHISYLIQMIPERVQDIDATLSQLANLMSWDKSLVAQLQKRIEQSRSDRPVLLQDKLSWSDVAPLSARLHRFSGINVLAGTHRVYPYAQLTSHLIGYLSMAKSEHIKAGFLPFSQVGRSGIEKEFEAVLHGTPGAQREEVDAMGRRISVIKSEPPVMGKRLQLGLDVEMQETAAAALGDRTGAVIVMDVNTGEILTLLSQPGFDTNHFITGLEEEQWNQWLEDPRKPLLNRTTQAAYPPASTFKLLVSLAGLKYQVPLISGSTNCTGSFELADRNLRCWLRTGHKHTNLYKAIVQSCDIYFYQIGDQLGITRLAQEAQNWGFGEYTGISLPSESRGIIPRLDENGRLLGQYAGREGSKWFRGETMIAAIGQGAVTVTPLQLARFAAAIANGGKLLKPQLVHGKTPKIIRQIDVGPEHLKKVQQAMRGVVADKKGTAHWKLNWAPLPVAGKTGTAQVIEMAQDEKRPSKILIDRHKDHAWFMGYAPFDKPEIAFAVFVEHGGHGGSAAAPIAAAIIKHYADHKKPTEEAAP